MRDHSKRTGDVSPVALSAGVKRMGRSGSQSFSGTVKLACFDSTGVQPLTNATTHHSFWSSGTSMVTSVCGVSAILVAAPSSLRRKTA